MLKRMLFIVVVFLFVAIPAISQEIQEYLQVTGQVVNVRALPSTKSTVLFQVIWRDTLRVIEEEGNWYHVEASNARRGYIHQSLVKLATSTTVFTKPSSASREVSTLTNEKASSFGNSDVVVLTRAKLSDGLIIDKIRQELTVEFDFSTGELVNLKKAGVSDVVIKAMITRSQELTNGDSNDLSSEFVSSTDTETSHSAEPSESQVDSLQDAQTSPKSPGRLGVGLSMGLSAGGTGPGVLYDINDRLTLRAGVVAVGFSGVGGGFIFRFPRPSKNLSSDLTFEPFVSGGMIFAGDSVRGFGGSAGSFFRHKSVPHWRFSGEITYFYISVGSSFNSSISFAGTGVGIGAHYFF